MSKSEPGPDWGWADWRNGSAKPACAGDYSSFSCGRCWRGGRSTGSRTSGFALAPGRVNAELRAGEAAGLSGGGSTGSQTAGLGRVEVKGSMDCRPGGSFSSGSGGWLMAHSRSCSQMLSSFQGRGGRPSTTKSNSDGSAFSPAGGWGAELVSGGGAAGGLEGVSQAVFSSVGNGSSGERPKILR